MEKQLKKNTKKKLKIKDPKRLLILLLIIIVIIVVVKPKGSNIKNNVSLIIQNEDKTNILENQIIINNDIIYLSLNDVKKCLDANIYLENDKIITTGDKKVAALDIDSSFIEINGSEVEINGQAFRTQDIVYIPISDLKNVYDIDFSYISEYKNIVIDYYSKKQEKANTTKNISVKLEKKMLSPSIEKIKKGDEVVFISEENGWAKIRTKNGNIGFMKKNKLTNFVVAREDFVDNLDVENEIFDIDITKKDITNFENRKKVMEEILSETISKKQKKVKIIYDGENDLSYFERFKIESKAFLKECGITAIF